ncbi:MAG: transcriptional repressor [Candidatus Saccharimonadales bacterium]|jgi:Fur family ferric uptake transcriptional regulator
MSAQEIFEKTLLDNNQSLTKPRQAVFTALGHHRSLTLREIVAETKDFDRSSIYRTLDLFEKLSIVVRIPQGFKHRFELGEDYHEHHHHATCSRCGASIALPEDELLEDRLRAIAAQRRFTLNSHQIELIGTCESCG